MTNIVPTLAQAINDKVAEAESKARGAMQCALEAGALLVKAKEQVPHGQWESWLADNCKVAPRTARSYMRLATKYPELPEEERQRVADLPLREAVKAIATDPVEPVRTQGIGFIQSRESRNRAEGAFQRAAKAAKEAAKFVTMGMPVNSTKAAALKNSLLAALKEIEKLQAEEVEVKEVSDDHHPVE